MRKFDPLRPWRGPLSSSPLETAFRVSLALVYLMIMYGFSSIPGPDVPLIIDDRIAHFVEYAGLGAVLLLVAAWRSRVAALGAVLAFAGGIAYAASDEFHQRFVDGRDASLRDLAFDAAGLAFAIVLIFSLTRPARAT